MTDVSMSNARRIIFTALALVAFWVLAWKAYWFFWPNSFRQILYLDPNETAWAYRVPIVAVIFTILPAVLLSMSFKHARLHRRAGFVVWSALAIACCLAFLAWLGEADTARLASEDLGLDSELSWSIARRSINRRWSAYREENMSWLWFLLPIVLTTTFVIYGAWRRAVRDVEIDAVNDEQ